MKEILYPTEEQMSNLYDRAVEVAKKMYNIDNDEVHINNDSITVKEWKQRNQDFDYVTLSVNDLPVKSLKEWEAHRDAAAIKEEKEWLQRIEDMKREKEAQQEKYERQEYERLHKKYNQ